MSKEYEDAKEDFLNHWGVVGPQWGVNRTMAQIHALLIITPGSLSTDQIMEELEISRGNAHKNIKELINWGLVYTVIKKGDRKEYFEAEKDVMTMFKAVIRERQKREIAPAMQIVSKCADRTKSLKGTEAELFHKQMTDIHDLLNSGSSILNKFTASERSTFIKLMLKALS